MSLKSDYADIMEAARLLGVTTRHVTRLGDRGEIDVPFRGLVDRDSIDRYLAERRGLMRGRAWDERTAWASIALLSGLDVDWLGQAQVSRLRTRLRDMATGIDDDSGAHVLIGKTRSRATAQTFESFDFLTSRVKKEILVVGRRGLGLAATKKTDVDGYVATDDLAGIVKRYVLVPDFRGKMILRVTGFDMATVKRISVKGNGALAALDAASSLDSREHHIGARALAKIMEEFARD